LALEGNGACCCCRGHQLHFRDDGDEKEGDGTKEQQDGGGRNVENWGDPLYSLLTSLLVRVSVLHCPSGWHGAIPRCCRVRQQRTC
jgi:hypothetical protein